MTTFNPDVAVIDFRLNNLKSIVRGLELAGAEVRVVAEPDQVAGATHLVLPGVGHFAAAMSHLQERGWPQALRDELRGRPLLGICLGMQLLFERSEEGGDVAGLALLPGTVTRLPRAGGQRVPHVGWNTVVPEASRSTEMFAGIEEDLDYYFVHSYAVAECDPETVLARTPFGDSHFVSVVGRGSTFGAQFHPEKSSHAGIRLLSNFLGTTRC